MSWLFAIKVIDPNNLNEWIDDLFEVVLGQMGWVLFIVGIQSFLA